MATPKDVTLDKVNLIYAKLITEIEQAGTLNDDELEKIKLAASNYEHMVCQLCGMCGHRSSCCWANMQVYDICRSYGASADLAKFRLLKKQAKKIELLKQKITMATETAEL